MDYEEEFADDEDINLGEFIDTEEATKRMHKGGWTAGDTARGTKPMVNLIIEIFQKNGVG